MELHGAYTCSGVGTKFILGRGEVYSMDLVSSLSPRYIVTLSDAKVQQNIIWGLNQFYVFCIPVRCALIYQLLEHVHTIFTKNIFLFKR